MRMLLKSTLPIEKIQDETLQMLFGEFQGKLLSSTRMTQL